MRNLNVRLDDDQYDALRVRADAGGVSVSAFVRNLIDASGGSEAVPPQGSVEDRASVSLPPPAPNNRTEGVSESPVLSDDSPPKTALFRAGAAGKATDYADARIAGKIVESHMEGDVRVVDQMEMTSISITASPVPPTFLAAPLDECPLCGHDRQESDHLGGRPCKFKTSPRRNCGCTFEGF